MPTLEESSDEEPEEDEEEEEDVGRSKSQVRKSGKSWWKDMIEEDDEGLWKSKRGATQVPSKRTPKLPTVFKKGKWNPDIELEKEDFELDYKDTTIW